MNPCKCGCGSMVEKTWKRGHHNRAIDVMTRFWSKVDKNGAGGCWLWLGYLHRGYGEFWDSTNATKNRAHVFAYRKLVGPVPYGMVLDHTCRNRSCVNPEHLELVSFQDNLLRGNGQPAINSRKTHCVHGHEFTPENTYVAGACGRSCKTCRRDFYEKKKAERAMR
jgi:hypothetical protein